MFWVDAFTEELKELIFKREELVKDKKSINERLAKGREFFKKEDSKNNKDLEKGVAQVLSLLEDLEKIENKIFDIDTIIVSKHEIYISNFIAKFKMPSRLSEAGDLIKHEEVYAVPNDIPESDRLAVTPDDIWFLKMIKSAYKANNIEFIKKSGESH